MENLAPPVSELPNGRWSGMSDAPERQSLQVRWAVITKMGRVVVEVETVAAREKVERKGYVVLEVNRDARNQTVSF
jgi:hypothetical protein